MSKRLYVPPIRHAAALLVIACLAVGYALYIRYYAIEHAPVSLACQGGQQSFVCTSFHAAIELYNHSVFGWVAVVAAALNLIRPSVVLIAIALAAAGLGLVLHNANLAGLAVALLILSLARRAPAKDTP